MPSVYNFLMGVTCINSSLERIRGIGSSGELVVGGFGLVDLTPWRFWTRCPMILASAYGQYSVALASVSPGHDEYLPVLMAFNHVERTGYPVAACK